MTRRDFLRESNLNLHFSRRSGNCRVSAPCMARGKPRLPSVRKDGKRERLPYNSENTRSRIFRVGEKYGPRNGITEPVYSRALR